MSDIEKAKPAKSQANHLKNTYDYLNKLFNKSQVEKGELNKLENDFLELKKKKLIPQSLLNKVKTIARISNGPKPVTILTEVHAELSELV